jgi:hypothetical protein
MLLDDGTASTTGLTSPALEGRTPVDPVTHLGKRWRIRWIHRFVRTDFIAVVWVVFGVVNSVRVGLSWLVWEPIAVVIYALGGLEHVRRSERAKPDDG